MAAIESQDERSPVEQLIQLLDLQPIEVNIFLGTSPKDRSQRVFGGQVLGQALVAAHRTVEGRFCHSLHAYFLLPGDPKVPILYEVDRSRDGQSFSSRRVVAIQHGRPIFHMSVSFQIEEPGLEHQIDAPTVPRPETLPSEDDFGGKSPTRFRSNIAIILFARGRSSSGRSTGSTSSAARNGRRIRPSGCARRENCPTTWR
jgi:acyl-CoA thioesterase-2